MSVPPNNTAGTVQNVLVIGTSGRMVAMLLRNAGCNCFVADLYGDRDTAEISDHNLVKLSSLSEASNLKGLLSTSNFVVFAGGLEGQANLAKRLGEMSNVAFASSDCLEKLADPQTFNAALVDVGIEKFPFRTRAFLDGQPFVRKSIAGSGSCKKITKMSTDSGRLLRSQVFQQWIDGPSVSVVFVASNGRVRSLGGSSQILHRMAWSGSISGLELSEMENEVACDFAERIVLRSGLVGVFGIDFVRNGNGIWPVDVNPRIPASVEVLARNVMCDHLKAFGIENDSCDHSDSSLVFGKQVVFNLKDRQVCIRPEMLKRFPFRHQVAHEVDSIADVPENDQAIDPGHPVLTVFTAGDSQGVVKSRLNDLADEVLREFTTEMQ